MKTRLTRGCGHRKIGALYLAADHVEWTGCGKLPLPLERCWACGAGVKQTRGFQWVKKSVLVPDQHGCGLTKCISCPLGMGTGPDYEFGLMWVGHAFYPTSTEFLREAMDHGVSKRISTLPHGFKIGVDMVALAHPKAIVKLVRPAECTCEQRELADHMEYHPGVFAFFTPQRVECPVRDPRYAETPRQKADMLRQEMKLRARGITPVRVRSDEKGNAIEYVKPRKETTSDERKTGKSPSKGKGRGERAGRR